MLVRFIDRQVPTEHNRRRNALFSVFTNPFDKLVEMCVGGCYVSWYGLIVAQRVNWCDVRKEIACRPSTTITCMCRKTRSKVKQVDRTNAVLSNYSVYVCMYVCMCTYIYMRTSFMG